MPVGRFNSGIDLVPKTRLRPAWSVMIPTYNCAAYLSQALASVLAQDLGSERMHIEVVDDHSTKDDPEAVVSAVGRGRVAFFRQPQNVGIPENLDTCLRRSRGRIVHLLHGDDAVRNGFYSKMQRAFDEYPNIGAAFCRQIFVDENGHWQSISPLEPSNAGIFENAVVRLAQEQRVMTPSIAVRRSVYERLGGFDARLKCSEDWEMWIRIAAHYPIWYEPEPLALYRIHTNSNTGRHVATGEDVRYTREAIRIFANYLPPKSMGMIIGRTKNTYALAALRNAEQMRANRDRKAMVAQIQEGLKLSCAPSVIRATARLLINFGTDEARRMLRWDRLASALRQRRPGLEADSISNDSEVRSIKCHADHR
jgi:glycosyltransferase involved in cell wall biosynthesis